jgi:hypothetical protein
MFQLVYGNHDLSLNLNFDAAIEDQLTLLVSMDTEANADDGSRPRSPLADLIVEAITAVVDPSAGNSAPTSKQLIYALAICRELNLPLPRDVLKDRAIMAAFLNTWADTYRRSRRARRQQSVADKRT